MDKVKKQMSEKSAKKSSAKPKPALEDKNKGIVVIPYVAGLSEKVSRVLKKHNISTAMKPYNTIRNILAHPKDKQEKRGTPKGCLQDPVQRLCILVRWGNKKTIRRPIGRA